MWKNKAFHELLDRDGHSNDIYEALEDDDVSKVVLTVLDILKETGAIPNSIEFDKNEHYSNSYRAMGNEYFTNKNYQKALEYYNRALQFAPCGSRTMKVTFNNRSLLLFKCRAYSATINDINIIFGLGGLSDKTRQLIKRKKTAEKLIDTSNMEALKADVLSNTGCLRVQQNHKQISCASNCIDVNTKDGKLPEVIASSNIKVGTVVALESPFVSDLIGDNFTYACYHCHTFSLNLIPCNQCVYALFCNTKCMDQCNKEHHNIICQLNETLQDTAATDKHSWNIFVKAAIKMKNLSTWKEFIATSKNMGLNRVSDSSIREIFAVEDKFSLLCAPDDKHFVYGTLYNHSFACAALIDRLDAIPSFFPGDVTERIEAKKAFCRILMFLKVYVRPLCEFPSTAVWTRDAQKLLNIPNHGLYPFAGKLKHQCDANLMAVVVKNKLALVAVKPIKKGTELTLSLWGHWYDNPPSILTRVTKTIRAFMGHLFICDCPICSDTKESHKYNLTEMHKKCLKNLQINKLDREELNGFLSKLRKSDIHSIYNQMCEALTILSDVQFSPECEKVFYVFRNILLSFQQNDSGNDVLLCDCHS